MLKDVKVSGTPGDLTPGSTNKRLVPRRVSSSRFRSRPGPSSGQSLLSVLFPTPLRDGVSRDNLLGPSVSSLLGVLEEGVSTPVTCLESRVRDPLSAYPVDLSTFPVRGPVDEEVLPLDLRRCH